MRTVPDGNEDEYHLVLDDLFFAEQPIQGVSMKFCWPILTFFTSSLPLSLLDTHSDP
jgi:hypothetical protein